jgi:hypothetical protein
LCPASRAQNVSVGVPNVIALEPLVYTAGQKGDAVGFLNIQKLQHVDHGRFVSSKLFNGEVFGASNFILQVVANAPQALLLGFFHFCSNKTQQLNFFSK